jgi:FdhD protein
MTGRTARRRVLRVSLPGGAAPRADLLAAELAAESGLTLVGFLRGGSMNVYTGAQRLGL